MPHCKVAAEVADNVSGIAAHAAPTVTAPPPASANNKSQERPTPIQE